MTTTELDQETINRPADPLLVERELKRKTLRQVCVRQAHKGTVSFAKFAPKFILLAVLAALLWSWRFNTVARYGEDVPARITQHQVYESKGTKHYSLDYRFFISDKSYADNEAVNLDEYTSLKDGDPIKVRTLPDFGGFGHIVLLPTRAIDQQIFVSRDLCLVLAGTSFFFYLIIEMAVWATFVPVKILVQSGQATLATIVEKTTVDGGKYGPSYRLRYKFTPRSKTGSRKDLDSVVFGTKFVSLADWNATNIDDVLTVLYDPIHPEINCLYKYCYFKAV